MGFILKNFRSTFFVVDKIVGTLKKQPGTHERQYRKHKETHDTIPIGQCKQQ
jgi:hypothetical protein